MTTDLRKKAHGSTALERLIWVGLFVQGCNGRRGLSYCLVGKPSTAKTSTLGRLAKLAGLHFEGVIASLRDPSDFLGLGVPHQMKLDATNQHLSPDGDESFMTMKYAPAAFAVRASIAKRALINLDEVNTAPPAVQAALLRMLFEGVCGELEMPTGVRQMLCMNSIEDAAGGYDIAGPLANRVGWLPFPEPSVARFNDYMMGLGGAQQSPVNPAQEEAEVDAAWAGAWAQAVGQVCGFLTAKTDQLHKMPASGSKASSEAWASPRCYTSDTEVMTARGWVAWPDVREDDLFATRAMDGQVQYLPAVERVCVPFEGELIRFHNRSTDLAVTPNHNMVVSRDHIGGSATAKRDAAREQFFLLAASDVEAELRERKTWAVRMPKTGTWPESAALTYQPLFGRLLPTAEFAELLGWILTDGYIAKVGKKPYVSVTQVDPTLRRRVAELMTICGFKLYQATDRVGTPDEDLWRFLQDQGRKHDGNRFVPRVVFEWGSDAIASLIAGLFGGDGWTTREGSQYFNLGPNARLAGDLQEAAMRLGGIANVSEIFTKRGVKCFEVRVFNSDRHAAPVFTAEHVSRVFYRGDVHCVRVPPHATLLVRQHGQAIWCGNTWEMATRAKAGGYIYDLSEIEVNQSIAAFVGQGAAGEFHTWCRHNDLPSPVDLLDGNVQFTHDARRLDRTAAILTSATSLITSNAKNAKMGSGDAQLNATRCEVLWKIHDALAAKAPDLSLGSVIALCQSRMMIGSTTAYRVLAKLEPIMSAAGITPDLRQP